MFILGIVGAVFILVAVVLTIMRLSFDVRLADVQKDPEQSPIFRRKVNYLKRIEQTKHIRYLLLTCLSFGIALVLFAGAFMMLADDHQRMKAQLKRTNTQIEYLEQKQRELIASIPLKNYPDNGIGLKDYHWEKLTDDDKDSQLKSEIEADIVEKTGDYFGSSETSVSLDAPKAMSIHLKGQAADTGNKETIKKNIDGFVKEAELIPELMEIHVRMITSVGKKKVVYNVNYSREKKEDSFKKTNISEQNLKNDGEKG